MPWPGDTLAALAAGGVVLSEAQQALLDRFASLVRERGRRLNLVSPGDAGRLYDRHIFDSLTAVPLAHWSRARVVDIGSGAGFPGIPLAVACPDARVVMTDRTRKRVLFVAHAIEELGLENAEAVWTDAGDLGSAAADIVTARAVADTRKVLAVADRLTKPNGRVMLWQTVRQWHEEPTPQGWSATWHRTASRDDVERGIRIVTRAG